MEAEQEFARPAGSFNNLWLATAITYSRHFALMQRVLDRAEVVVANSGYTAQLVRTMAPSARIAAVPLGVDHRRFVRSALDG